MHDVNEHNKNPTARASKDAIKCARMDQPREEPSILLINSRLQIKLGIIRPFADEAARFVKVEHDMVPSNWFIRQVHTTLGSKPIPLARQG